MPVTHFTLMIVTYIRVSALDAFDIFHRAPLNSMTYITVPLMTLKYFYNSALDANISKTAPLITVTYFTVSALDTRDILQLCSSALNQTNSLLCARVSGADVVQGSFIILPYHSGFQRSMIYDAELTSGKSGDWMDQWAELQNVTNTINSVCVKFPRLG